MHIYQPRPTYMVSLILNENQKIKTKPFHISPYYLHKRDAV